MELKQLRYFYTVCEEKNISKAASKLFVTQQGISKSLQSLETELDVTLFYRFKTGVTLTPEGEYLKRKCHYILNYIDDMVKEIGSLGRKHQQEIKVSIINGAGVFFSNTFLENFTKPYSQFKITIRERDVQQCETDVMNRISDAAITVYPIQSDRFFVKLLLSAPLCIMMSKNNSLSQKKILQLKDLEGQELIIISDLSQRFSEVKQSFKKRNVDVSVSEAVFNVFSALELCRKNQGITIMANKLRHSLIHSDLVFVPIDPQELTWDLYLITDKSSSDMVKLDILAEYLRRDLLIDMDDKKF